MGEVVEVPVGLIKSVLSDTRFAFKRISLSVVWRSDMGKSGCRETD